MRYLFAAILGCATLAYGDSPVQKADLLSAKTILFLGDSITYDGRYVAAIETWLLTQPSETPRKVVNVGLPSETVSGLTEEGHAGGAFPRPVLRERLDRVLKEVKPDFIFACYGMNCGIYMPFDEQRFAAYRDGITELHEAATKAGAKIVFITPAAFDKKRAQGYVDYDDVLTRYSEWLVSQRDRGWTVIDLHGAMVMEIARQRETNAEFTFSPDSVHPDDAGHWFMAQQVIAYFDPAAAQAESADTLPGVVPGAYALVRERMGILRDGMLTSTGHKHPGIPAGLPMDEVNVKVSALTEKLNALYPKP